MSNSSQLLILGNRIDAAIGRWLESDDPDSGGITDEIGALVLEIQAIRPQTIAEVRVHLRVLRFTHSEAWNEDEIAVGDFFGRTIRTLCALLDEADSAQSRARRPCKGELSNFESGPTTAPSENLDRVPC